MDEPAPTPSGKSDMILGWLTSSADTPVPAELVGTVFDPAVWDRPTDTDLVATAEARVARDTGARYDLDDVLREVGIDPEAAQ